MREIQLRGKNSKDKCALVDDSDFEWLNQYKWYFLRDGHAYRHIKINNKSTLRAMHRDILKLTNSNIHGDHINHNKLDNQRSNLRKATPAQNNQNRIQSNNKSGYVGVFTDKRTPNRYFAQIKYEKKGYRKGTFGTKEQAALAYNELAKRFYGKNAYQNIIKNLID